MAVTGLIMKPGVRQGSGRGPEAGQVTRGQLLAMIQAGTRADCADNNQPWRFAIVRNGALLEQVLGKIEPTAATRRREALIVVLIDQGAVRDYTRDYQTIGACLQKMLLAAQTAALDARWLGVGLKEGAALRSLLRIPEMLEPLAVVAVGRFLKRRAAPRRKGLEAVLLEER